MKLKLRIPALLLALLLALTACGGGSKEEKKGSESAKGEKKSVVIVLPMDHLALNEVEKGIKEVLTAKYGDNITIDVKNANGDSSLLNSILQDAVSKNPDMILPIATGPAQVAATTTKEIPVVFSAVTDPVAAGLCKSWTEAGANVTGVSDMTDVNKILDFMMQLYPNAKTIGLVYSSSETNSVVQIEEAKKALEARGLKWKEGTITNTSELQQVVENLLPQVDAFYTPTDNNVASAMPTFRQVADKEKKPIFPGATTMVESGGTATCGLNYLDLGKQTGEMAIRILDGQTVAENPPEKVEKVVYVVNEDQMKNLGFKIPDSIKDVEYVKTAQ